MSNINLDSLLKDNIENQGGITDNTALAGDLSGTLPNPTVASLQGLALPTSGFADGLGLRISGGVFVLDTLLTEDSAFVGDVTGSQAGGLSVTSIDNNPVEISNPQAGQVLKYNGSNFENAADESGYVTTDVKTSAYTASNKEKVRCDSTSGAFTVTLPANPVSGYQARVVDSAGSFGTNAVTVIGDGSDSIRGLPAGLTANVNNAYIEFSYNGSEWVFYVISVRA